MSARHVPSVSVLMPTFEQAAFIPRALDSLQAQSLADWEAIVVDDGYSDATRRKRCGRGCTTRGSATTACRNNGLGHALNRALALARAPLIAYLPSDDVYYREHLHSLKDLLDTRPDAVLAFSGVRHHYNREAPGAIAGQPLQLVQCLHRANRRALDRARRARVRRPRAAVLVPAARARRVRGHAAGSAANGSTTRRSGTS